MVTREIEMKIHEESDLYSSLDPKQELLSEDVTQYIARNYLDKNRSLKENYIIHIISDTPVNEEKVKKSIVEHYTTEQDNIRYELKKLTVKEICLGVFGAIILSIWLYLSARSSSVRIEILSIVGWVAIWEATSIVIMARPELHQVYKALEKAVNAEIIIDVAGTAADHQDNG